MKPLIEARLVKKSFGSPSPVAILRGISFSLLPGETLAICGKSGCGKSTLLHILGGLERASSGEILYEGKEAEDLPSLLQNEIGFVFQSFHLLEDYTALENVLMPMQIARKRKGIKERAKELLREVGLEGKEELPAPLLSGGEKQRVALARALANEPKLLLADEPTGNLDEENRLKVADLLFSTLQKRECALILVTHDEELAARCSKRVVLHGGLLCP